MRLVTAALEWERTFGVAPAITSSLSEYDAATLVGCTPESYGLSCTGRTAVSRGHDFVHGGKRYQVKANRPSGKPGSEVTLVAKAGNYEWDFLIWLLYDRSFEMLEAWLWPVEEYKRAFEVKVRLSPTDMRGGTRLFPAAGAEARRAAAAAAPVGQAVGRGIKVVTAENWLMPDMCRIFPDLTEAVWFEEILRPKLGPGVPEKIQDLFDCARGLFAYGFLFYPLCMLGTEQLHRVAEAAAGAKCRALNLPTQIKARNGRVRITNFSENIDRLGQVGAIAAGDLDWWHGTRGLRNMGSHPELQMLMAPGALLPRIAETAEYINRLFQRGKASS